MSHVSESRELFTSAVNFRVILFIALPDCHVGHKIVISLAHLD